jgi:ABC-type multidrug transport system fused ATPase/permease subunit
MSRTLAAASKISILDGFISENSNAINLSGGQKQLICLLRALYRDPDILFLDEATSSLDNSSDNQINEMLQSEKRNRAVIVIAHRMSSVKIADEIIFMESGFIKSKGTLEQVRSEVDLFDELINLSMDI